MATAAGGCLIKGKIEGRVYGKRRRVEEEDDDHEETRAMRKKKETKRKKKTITIKMTKTMT